jgi:hypothetical protein
MGLVFVADDPKLGRKVAIKVLRGEGVGTEAEAQAAQRRLEREAQALARLSHPNVVPVFDTGVSDGRVFLAMELVEGQTLAVWLREPRTLAETLDVLLQSGRGLAAAHAAGWVHRDVKPSNVLVGRDGRVRVVDFGLARAPRAANLVEQTRAAEGDVEGTKPPSIGTTAIAGTPAYMAPEQYRGVVDALCDQYSFGVMLYEALFGRLPPRENAVVEPPAKTSQGQAVPDELRRIVARTLSTDRPARYPEMGALLEALEAERGRLARPERHNRGALLAAALVAAGGLAAVTVWVLRARAHPASNDQHPAVIGGGTDLYVDPNGGSDASVGEGTQAHPFKTITHANATLGSTGGTIHLHSGSYSIASGEAFPITLKPGTTILGDTRETIKWDTGTGVPKCPSMTNSTSCLFYVNGPGVAIKQVSIQNIAVKSESSSDADVLVDTGGAVFLDSDTLTGTTLGLQGGGDLVVQGSGSAEIAGTALTFNAFGIHLLDQATATARSEEGVATRLENDWNGVRLQGTATFTAEEGTTIDYNLSEGAQLNDTATLITRSHTDISHNNWDGVRMYDQTGVDLRDSSVSHNGREGVWDNRVCPLGGGCTGAFSIAGTAFGGNGGAAVEITYAKDGAHHLDLGSGGHGHPASAGGVQMVTQGANANANANGGGLCLDGPAPREADDISALGDLWGHCPPQRSSTVCAGQDIAVLMARVTVRTDGGTCGIAQ